MINCAHWLLKTFNDTYNFHCHFIGQTSHMTAKPNFKEGGGNVILSLHPKRGRMGIILDGLLDYSYRLYSSMS